MTQIISLATAKLLKSKIWHNKDAKLHENQYPNAGVLTGHSGLCSASAQGCTTNPFPAESTGAQQKWWQNHHNMHSASPGMWFQYAPSCSWHCGRYFIVCLSTESFLQSAGQVASATQIQLNVKLLSSGFFLVLGGERLCFPLFPILFNSINMLLRQKLGVITPDFLSSSSIINQRSSIINPISWKDAFQTSPVYSSPAASWLKQSSCPCSECCNKVGWLFSTGSISFPVLGESFQDKCKWSCIPLPNTL